MFFLCDLCYFCSERKNSPRAFPILVTPLCHLRQKEPIPPTKYDTMEKIPSLPEKKIPHDFVFDCDDIKALSAAIVAELQEHNGKQKAVVVGDKTCFPTKGFFSTHEPRQTPEPKSTCDASVEARSDPTIPSRLDLGPVLYDEQEALCFLEEKGVINPVRTCPDCENPLVPMSRNLGSKSRFVLRCRRCRCKGYSCSMLAGTILANCKLNKAKFIDFVYHWLLGIKHETVGKSLGMSSSAIADWANYLQEACASDLPSNNKEDGKISGPTNQSLGSKNAM